MTLTVSQGTATLTLTVSQGGSGGGSVEDLNDLGVTATATELNYVGGVTSNIQTQIIGKQSILSEGAFVNGDKTKLNGIEAGAEVNDTPTEIVTKIDTELGNSDWKSIVSMPIEQKLKNWFDVLENDPSNATLAFVGDSTSDLAGNASSLDDLIDDYTFLGFGLEGFDIANMPNYGFNGQTIVTFISDNSEKGLVALSVANIDLVIFSYGINDIRLNNLTKDQLKGHIITCINTIKAGSPNTDIILRMPNSFDIPVDQDFIQLGGYDSLAEAAQAQSNILYEAYKELEFYWDDVVLFNTQDLLYGRTSTATISYLHTDEIHPRYPQMIDILVDDFIGKYKTYNEKSAERAIEFSATPWTSYPRVFEKQPEFIKMGEGTLGAVGTGFTRFDVGTYDAYKYSQEYRYGDYISIGKGAMIVTNTVGLSYNNDSRLQYSAELPANSFVAGEKVEFFRARYNNRAINKRYLEDKNAYPYARRVRLGTCGTNFLRIQSLLDDNIITPITRGVTAVMLNMKTTDILVLSDGTALTLTGATFSDVSNTKNIAITGSYAAYQGTVAFLFANKPYEDASVITGTGTVIDMSGRSQYNFASASAATTFTMLNINVGGYGETLINTTSQPAVTGATIRGVSTWLTGTNMVLCIKDYNGTRKFWFEAY